MGTGVLDAALDLYPPRIESYYISQRLAGLRLRLLDATVHHFTQAKPGRGEPAINGGLDELTVDFLAGPAGYSRTG
jgi:hypothetical protein